MSPEEVPEALVQQAAAAAYAMHYEEARAWNEAEYGLPLDPDDWPEWDPEDEHFSEMLREQRHALAAVFPVHRKQVIEEVATAVERQDSRRFPGRGWDYQYAAALRNYAHEDE